MQHALPKSGLDRAERRFSTETRVRIA